MDWDEVEFNLYQAEAAIVRVALDSMLDRDDHVDDWVSYEDHLLSGGEDYESSDLMDVCECVPYDEGVDYDNVPAVLERCLQEGF